MTEPGAFDHITNPRKRAFLRAFAASGQFNRAAEAAGVHHDTPYSDGWRDDAEFQAALELARQMAARYAEDAAFQRAIEGATRYFHSKDGDPLMHPTLCRCGHDDEQHVTGETWPATPEIEARWIEPKGKRPGYWTEVVPARPARPKDVRQADTASCLTDGCGCERFRPAPYVEQVVSDKLLEKVLTAHVDRFAERRRIEVAGALSRIDPRAFPHDLMARLADGEAIEQILTELFARGQPLPLLPAPGEIVVDAPRGGGDEGGGGEPKPGDEGGRG